MIYLGIAIVVATILVILDRNHAFPQAWGLSRRALKVSGKLAAFLVAATLVTWSIFVLLAWYQEEQRTRNAPLAPLTAAPPRFESGATPEQAFAENVKKDDARRAAARHAEHARNISQIKLKEIRYSGGDLRDIQIQNDTPVVIRSITLAITKAPGEQPTYVKFWISIEPGKYSFFSKGERSDGNGNGCAINQVKEIICGYGLGLQGSEKAQIEVKDFEGGARQ
jgi:hypothetical protein